MGSRLEKSSEAIEDAAMLLQTLLDQGSLAVAVVDEKGRLEMMSRGLQDIMGTSSLGPDAADFPRHYHLYDVEGAALLRPEDVPVTRAAAGETVRDVVISVRRPGEPVRYLRCNAMPLKGPDGGNAGAVVLVADVTAEQTAVSRQDAIRTLLLDTVNHELRTPLTVMLANAELVLDAADSLPENVRSPLAAIVRASGRLRDTVQQVTDLVDLESVAHPVRARTDVSGLLETVVARHRKQAEARDVSVFVDCPPALEWNLDAALVTRAVSALLENALVHGPGNSDVTIKADVAEDLLHLRVVDRGGGIPPHDQERLTKPFERGSGSTAHARHSRGLGLALAQAVATSHHGALLLRRHRPFGFSAGVVLA
jgi:signal transduction histidine kinase